MAEFLHEVLQAEPLIGFDLVEPRRFPVHVEGADGRRFLVCRWVCPVVRPYVDGGAARIVAAAVLHVMVIGIAKERLKLLVGVGEVDWVAGGEHVGAPRPRGGGAVHGGRYRRWALDLVFFW